jgi:hypothetical protein
MACDCVKAGDGSMLFSSVQTYVLVLISQLLSVYFLKCETDQDKIKSNKRNIKYNEIKYEFESFDLEFRHNRVQNIDKNVQHHLSTTIYFDNFNNQLDINDTKT